MPFSSLQHQARRVFWYSAVPFFWVISTPVFLNDNVIEVSWIDGESMAPTLSRDFQSTGRGDWVLWNKWDPTANLHRGAVVLSGSPNNPEINAVKRVVALEGDTVLLDPRRRPRKQSDGSDMPESRSWDMWPRGRAKVPEGHVWVEGDNWRKSNDSNWYGPMSKSLIIGRAVAVVGPWERFWEKPWEGYKSRTKVVPGEIVKNKETDDLALIEAAG